MEWGTATGILISASVTANDALNCCTICFEDSSLLGNSTTLLNNNPYVKIKTNQAVNYQHLVP